MFSTALAPTACACSTMRSIASWRDRTCTVLCTGTLAIGQTATCTVTNDDIAPVLTVVKHVVNDDGGTKTAADFSLTVDDPGTNPAAFSSAAGAGTPDAGSSGSALFQSIGASRYVVGQLYGGNSSCTNAAGSNFYGRFDVASDTEAQLIATRYPGAQIAFMHPVKSRRAIARASGSGSARLPGFCFSCL